MSEWKVKTIGDLGDIITGKTPKTCHPEYFGGDIPFITPCDIEQRFAFKTQRYWTEAGAQSVKSCILPPLTVAVSCIGSDMGKSIMTAKKSVTNQQFNAIVVNDENDPYFVFYLTSYLLPVFRQEAGGSTAVPIVNKGAFSKIKTRVPSIAIQKRVSAVLSAIDDKIELNRRLNDNLPLAA